VKIIAINGSPHRNGLTQQLLDQAVEGAESQGLEVERWFLADYHIEPCQACRGSNCWTTGKCTKFEDDLPKLNEELDRAYGLIFGAPVYYLDMNAIPKNFLDRTRLLNANGKPAMGIAVAGGSGKGLTSALKSLYYYFFCVSLRGIHPLPVCRFNFEVALKEAYEGGVEVARKASQVEPFSGLADRFVWHRNTKFMDFDIIDENLYLDQLIIENTKPSDEFGRKELEIAKNEYEIASELVQQGRKDEAAPHIEKAYIHGSTAWNSVHK